MPYHHDSFRGRGGLLKQSSPARRLVHQADRVAPCCLPAVVVVVAVAASRDGHHREWSASGGSHLEPVCKTHTDAALLGPRGLFTPDCGRHFASARLSPPPLRPRGAPPRTLQSIAISPFSNGEWGRQRERFGGVGCNLAELRRFFRGQTYRVN